MIPEDQVGNAYLQYKREGGPDRYRVQSNRLIKTDASAPDLDLQPYYDRMVVGRLEKESDAEEASRLGALINPVSGEAVSDSQDDAEVKLALAEAQVECLRYKPADKATEIDAFFGEIDSIRAKGRQIKQDVRSDPAPGLINIKDRWNNGNN